MTKDSQGSIICPLCGQLTPLSSDACPECGQSLESVKVIKRLINIPGVGIRTAEILFNNGFTSAEQIVSEGVEKLVSLPQIGTATSKNIIKGANEYLEKEIDEQEEISKQDDDLEDDEDDLEEEDYDLDEELNDLFGGEEIDDFEEDIEEDFEEDYDVEMEMKKLFEEEEPEEITEDGEGTIKEESTVSQKEPEGSKEKPAGKEKKTTEKKGKAIIPIKQKATQLCPSCGNILSQHSQGCPKCGLIFDMGQNKNLYSSVFISLSSFLFPLFLMVYVSLEFLTSLFANPYIYPYRALLYFTPVPLFIPSWLLSIALSFLIVFVLFIVTSRGIEIVSRGRNLIIKNRGMLYLAVVLSFIITISLGIYVVSSTYSASNFLSYGLFILALSTFSTQTYLLLIMDSDFIALITKKFAQEKYIHCPYCEMPLHPDARECKYCGKELGISDTVEEREQKGMDTIVCQFCGEKLPSDTKECPECGEKLKEKSDEELLEELAKI